MLTATMLPALPGVLRRSFCVRPGSFCCPCLRRSGGAVLLRCGVRNCRRPWLEALAGDEDFSTLAFSKELDVGIAAMECCPGGMKKSRGKLLVLAISFWLLVFLPLRFSFPTSL